MGYFYPKGVPHRLQRHPQHSGNILGMQEKETLLQTPLAS